MAGALKHRFVSLLPDGAQAEQIQMQRDWNDEHLFGGSTTGALLAYDSAQTDHANWIASAAVGKFLRSGGVGVLPAWSALTIPSTIAQGALVVGTAADVIGVIAAVAAGRLLRAAGVGTVPAWSTLTIPDTVAQGDLLTASAANVLAALADVAVGSVLVSGGVGAVPAWSASPSVTDLTHSGNLVASPGNGATWTRGALTELVTLSVVGATTDSVANLLPANAIIEAVVARVTTTILTATDWAIGDADRFDRFTAPNATLVAGTTDIGTRHIAQPDVIGGPRQVTAAKLRLTTTGTPTAGVVRVTVFYRQFVAPTS